MVGRRARAGTAAGIMARREILRLAGGLAAAAFLPGAPAAAQTYSATSISQAAQRARRDVGLLGLRADNLLRHMVADGPAHPAVAVRRFRGEQARLARDLATIFNKNVSEDDWLLIVPTRELDFVLAMQPLGIRLAPSADMVEAMLKRRLPQIDPMAGDEAEDVLLTIVFDALGLDRRVALFEQMRNDPVLVGALKDAAAAVKATRYGLAVSELERVMRAMVAPDSIKAVQENLGKDAVLRLYNALIVRFVPFLGWTYFNALLLATIYFNRDTTATVLR